MGGDRGAAELLAEQAAGARERLSGLRAEFDDIVAATADSNSDDEHDPEGATIGYERARVASLIRQTEASLVEIERALERVDEGSYGRCLVCGQPIAPARLQARPTARTCIDCASRPPR
jgi:DnaK suppressor protein